jgi:hypothetical protein
VKVEQLKFLYQKLNLVKKSTIGKLKKKISYCRSHIGILKQVSSSIQNTLKVIKVYKLVPAKIKKNKK